MSLNFKKGDTLVEVAFAIAIFALVSLICINVMNAGLNSAQNSLEASMARNEIDAQAEAIRFVHNAFTLEREEVIENQQYRDLWDKLSRDSNSGVSGGMANEATSLPELSVSACSEIYDKNSPKSIFKNDLTAFVMNTRMIDPEDQTFNNGVKDLNKIIVSTRNLDADNIFTETPLYPRLLFADNVSGSNISDTNSDAELAESSEYRYLARAEGIWVIAIKDETKSSQNGGQLIPEFFDFHIRTCWYGPGGTRPNTIGTIVRLYNPELIERIK
ncbi:hypothetical protein IJG91_02955 [Candidatus Saccharibacteria bacterium]|mgnify:CR=1 FL=1|nr:hypothetical protein [Candidatus Saccharibacteria bacterium]